MCGDKEWSGRNMKLIIILLGASWGDVRGGDRKFVLRIEDRILRNCFEDFLEFWFFETIVQCKVSKIFFRIELEWMLRILEILTEPPLVPSLPHSARRKTISILSSLSIHENPVWIVFHFNCCVHELVLSFCGEIRFPLEFSTFHSPDYVTQFTEIWRGISSFAHKTIAKVPRNSFLYHFWVFAHTNVFIIRKLFQLARALLLLSTLMARN